MLRGRGLLSSAARRPQGGVKGDAVITTLGFWRLAGVRQRTLNDEGAVLSDTVLLEEEVNPLISAANAVLKSARCIHFFLRTAARLLYARSRHGRRGQFGASLCGNIPSDQTLSG